MMTQTVPRTLSRKRKRAIGSVKTAPAKPLRSEVKQHADTPAAGHVAAQQLANLVADLEKTLHKQIEFEGKLLDLLKLKKQAMRDAKPDDITVCCELENAAVRQITELEKSRLQQIGGLTAILDPKAAEPLTLMSLAERLPEPIRGRLLVLRAMLREKAEHVREQLAITRRASEGLLNNMQGVIRNVTDSLAGGARIVGPPRPVNIRWP